MTIRRSGIILAGGNSRRMGEPKALLELGGAPLIALVARPLVETCEELILSVAPPAHTSPGFVEACLEALALVRDSKPIVVRDRETNRGPAAGLATALTAARGELAFVTGCDSPFLATALVRGLLERGLEPDAPDVVLPVYQGRPEPLLAVYRTRSMATHFAQRMREENGPITAGMEMRNVVHIDETTLRQLDPSGDSFRNVNTPADYRRAAGTRAPAGKQEPR